MHGIFRFLDQRMDTPALEAERKLLSKAFGGLLNSRPKSDKTVEKATKKTAPSMMAAMEEIGERDNPDNSRIAAGYTYFGQLLAHDLSVHRFLGDVSPALRLRTLYGLGPGLAPYLFNYKPLKDVGLRFKGVKMTLEEYTTEYDVKVYDVPRHNIHEDKAVSERSDNIPLMADARNDQNFIISQMFVQLARAHNFLVDAYYNPNEPENQGQLFKKASTALIGIYQAIILYDYLDKILFDPGIIEKLKNRDNFIFYRTKGGSVKLSEIFSRAAFRVGHAQVRHIYRIFANREPVTLFGKEDLDLRGFVRDTRRAIDWNLFFGKKNGKFIQSAKQFNHRISLSLNELPFLKQTDQSLVNINLRQSSINMAYGWRFYEKFSELVQRDLKKEGESVQFTAAELKCLADFSPDKVSGKINEIFGKQFDYRKVPLWMFLLLEAEIVGKGEKLGPLGSRIIAEQIMWTLLDDPASILNKPENFPDNILAGNMQSATLYELLTLGETLQQKKTEEDNPMPEKTPAPPPAETEFAAKLLSNEEQEYRGIELHRLDSIEEFLPYKQNIDTLVNRTLILNNGFYDIATPRDLDYEALCSTGQYREPGGTAKQQIRVYVSRRSILYNLGFPGMGDDDPDMSMEDEAIKGLLFIFGKGDDGKLEFIVKRIDRDGKVPSAVEDIWYRTDLKHLVYADTSCKDENLALINNVICDQAELYGKLVGKFIKDGFNVLKTTGRTEPVVIGRKVLLEMLGLDPNLQGAVLAVEFHLSAATGSEIMQYHSLVLPAGDPQTTVPNAMFFNLALSSTDPSNGRTELYSEANRPYPYWCYKD